MHPIHSISDLNLLRESVALECKLAAGRDGKGALPEDFWPTYSAFANTAGGVVVLGVRERQDSFHLEGLADVAKVRRELFNELNNRHKVSANLLSDAHVQEIELEGKTLLLVDIPRANRKQRPVHLTKNPFGNTFRRLNDGDRTVPDEEVKRMLAEQVEDSRDNRILHGYSMDELSMETFRAYRQVFANREPEHPWTALDDQGFLHQIGGWRKDRETGESGLTLAGLLMFGLMAAIQEELPNYMLDYQERPEAKIELRWVDRLTLDGKWSGNLYDFYRRVYLKLTADLKVPFALEKGERRDETVVHVALREALANVLVHADYSDRASVLVVKRPDMFGFRNPGLMRVPPEIAIRGGEHDCRNRTLHKMFRFVGIGEQAGSGIPKIYHGWASQHWRAPALYERVEPYNQTLLELRMVDLLPKPVLDQLHKMFGSRFEALGRNERLALAAVASEVTVTHGRIRELTGLPSFDASRLLQSLVRGSYLESHNSGRGTVYCLPGASIPTPEEVFGSAPAAIGAGSPNLELKLAEFDSSSPNLESNPAEMDLSSPNLELKLAEFDSSSPNLESNPAEMDLSSPNLVEERDADGCLLTNLLRLPVVDDLSQLSSSLLARLETIAEEPRNKGRVDREVLIHVIVSLCNGRFITLRCLAELVNRKPDTLRDQYLTQLVRDRKLSMAFPTTPTHERQAYCTSSSLASSS